MVVYFVDLEGSPHLGLGCVPSGSRFGFRFKQGLAQGAQGLRLGFDIREFKNLTEKPYGLPE